MVRNKNVKPRTNQQSSASHPMGNQYGRGRNNGNNYRGGSSQMAGGRNYYEQNSTQYTNQSQQFYHHHQQGPSQNSSYRSNNNNNNRQPPSSGSRQRLNSNRSNNSRQYSDTNEPRTKGISESSNDINNNSVSSGILFYLFFSIYYSLFIESRPRLQLLPRSQKPASSDVIQTTDVSKRNANIFGCGK